MVNESIQECCYHLPITKNGRPFGKAKIGRDDHVGEFVSLAKQMKQQRTTTLAKRQITQLV